MRQIYCCSMLFACSGILFSCKPTPGCGVFMNYGKWIPHSMNVEPGRSEAVSFTIGNTAYVGTGWDDSSINYSDFWQYNQIADSWTEVAGFPKDAGRSGSVAFAIGSFGYCGTGYNGNQYLNDFYRYDSANNSWTKCNGQFPGKPRSKAIGFSIGNFGYVGTGFDGNSGLADLYQYNPENDSWSAAIYPGPPRYGSSVMIFNNKAYLVAGENADSLLSDFRVFDPNNDSSNWSSLRPIVNASTDSYDDSYTSIVRSNACSFIADGRGFLAHGERHDTIVNDTWLYDFHVDLWQKETKFPGNPLTGATGMSVNEHGYVIFGRTGHGHSTETGGFWEFMP